MHSHLVGMTHLVRALKSKIWKVYGLGRPGENILPAFLDHLVVSLLYVSTEQDTILIKGEAKLKMIIAALAT